MAPSGFDHLEPDAGESKKCSGYSPGHFLSIGALLLLVGCAAEVESPARDLPPVDYRPVAMQDVPIDRASLVRVHAEQADSFDLCSGVVVAPEHVATAAHCLRSETMQVQGRSAIVIGSDNPRDIAFLYVPGLDRPVARIAPELPAWGAEVFIAGFGCTGGAHVQFRAGAFAAVVDGTPTAHSDAGKVEVSGLACEGDSGGALVDVEGRVIGILSTSNIGTRAWAVPAELLREWLR